MNSIWKGRKDLNLCGIEIKLGEKKKAQLVVNGDLNPLLWVVRGTPPGATLVVTAEVHGCEYVGILAGVCASGGLVSYARFS